MTRLADSHTLDHDVMRHPDIVTVAALYVDPAGAYANLPGVEVWDEARDARLYPGPWPVIAHPPCQRWSPLSALVEANGGKKRGEDAGCFAAALLAVERWGGVLEHPAGSLAWRHFGLPVPGRDGWATNLFRPGASAYVEQGHYGAGIAKGTWLYACGVELPALAKGKREYPYKWGAANQTAQVLPHLPKRLRAATPPAFRDTLLAMARSTFPESEPLVSFSL